MIVDAVVIHRDAGMQRRSQREETHLIHSADRNLTSFGRLLEQEDRPSAVKARAKAA